MYITYKDICKYIFNWRYYYTDSCGCIKFNTTINIENVNNSTNVKQLERLLALNQLHNIVEYYNSLSAFEGETFQITYSNYLGKYYVQSSSSICSYGFTPLFNNEKDAEAVIDNPNFREILDIVYKDC